MNRLSSTTWIVIGMLGGVLAGVLFGPIMGEFKIVGDIFLRLIQMSVVVMVMGAVIEAVGSLNPQEMGRIGLKTLFFFFCTTTLAASFGLLMADILQPGTGLPAMTGLDYKGMPPDQGWSAMLLNFFPRNIVESMAKGEMIQVIVFAVLFGMALSLLGKHESSIQIFQFVRHINVLILEVVKIVMKLAPIGIFALLGWVTGVIGLAVIIPLAKFLLGMLVAAVATFIVVLLLVSSYTRLNPFRLARKMNRMALVALTTTSSAITLPVKMSDSENRIGISKRISRLVNPLGMALNSDGLALYLALACMTVAQFFNIDMPFAMQVKVVVMAVLATLGTVVVPGGGLVALAIVFPVLGLPLEGVALLAGIDWFSGMIRTAMNVVDDVLVAVVIAEGAGELDRNIFDNPLPDNDLTKA